MKKSEKMSSYVLNSTLFMVSGGKENNSSEMIGCFFQFVPIIGGFLVVVPASVKTPKKMSSNNGRFCLFLFFLFFSAFNPSVEKETDIFFSSSCMFLNFSIGGLKVSSLDVSDISND